MRRHAVSCLTMVALAASAAAHAAPIRVHSAAAFRNAAGPLVTESFSRCGRATATITGPLTAAGNGPCAAGSIRPGLQFHDDPGPFGQQLFIAGPGFGANRTTALGQTDPAADALWITFDAPVAAVGFVVFQNLGGGATRPAPLPVAVRLFGLDDALLGAFDVAVGPRGSFFGALDPASRVARVSINSPVSFDMIDNVRFSRPFEPRSAPFGDTEAAEPTPAPATLALFALGLAAVARRFRRG